MAGEEGVEFGGGVADAFLEFEDGDAGLAWFGEAGAAEDFEGEGVGLGVVGSEEGEEGRFAGAWGVLGQSV